jgi:thiamine biosynthesis protein ThiS
VASAPKTITIHLNGEPYAIEAEAKLEALLKKLGLQPTRVGVEINQAVVPKADYARTILRPGDEVEIINFVGGG